MYKPSWNYEVRLTVLKDRPVDGNYVEGVNCWSVYAVDVQERVALLGQWAGPVPLAMHAAIRKLANRKRQELVREFTLKLIAEESHLKGWVSMVGHFSFMPAYWNLFDVSAARAMLRVWLDVACNEGALRSNIPIIVKQPGGQQAIVMDKIADRVLLVRRN